MKIRSLSSNEMKNTKGGASIIVATGALGTLTIDAAWPWLGAIAAALNALLTNIAGMLGSLV